MATSYPINKSDGTLAFNISPGTFNTSFSVGLLGKGVTNYGEIVAENFLHMLENFAAPQAPGVNPNLNGLPTTGQLWYDTNEKTLKIYDASTTPNWRYMTIGSGPISGATFPTGPLVGQVFYLTAVYLGSAPGLYYWTGSAWSPVNSPISGSSFPVTGLLVGQIFYLTSSPVGLYYWDGSTWLPMGTDPASLATLDTRYVSKTVTANQTVSSPLTFSNTDYMTLPKGTTGQRPAPATDVITGMIRYNTTLNKMEVATVGSPSPTWETIQSGAVAGFLPLSGGTMSGSIVMGSGSVQIADGTVSAPSLSFGSDAASGMYRPGANQLGFAANGINRLNVLSSGGNFSGVWQLTGAGSQLIATGGATISASYADLAERYEADEYLAPGTVVKFGGTKEVTKTSSELDGNVFGVVSTNPAYRLNAEAGDNETHPLIAFAGRLPCKVSGTGRKGDRLVSSEIPGVARVISVHEYCDFRTTYAIFGRLLNDKTTNEVELVEVVVGAK